MLQHLEERVAVRSLEQEVHGHGCCCCRRLPLGAIAGQRRPPRCAPLSALHYVQANSTLSRAACRPPPAGGRAGRRTGCGGLWTGALGWYVPTIEQAPPPARNRSRQSTHATSLRGRGGLSCWPCRKHGQCGKILKQQDAVCMFAAHQLSCCSMSGTATTCKATVRPICQQLTVSEQSFVGGWFQPQ